MDETPKDKEKPTTMIRLQKRTRDRLKARGKKGESYDDVIARLLKEYEERREMTSPFVE